MTAAIRDTIVNTINRVRTDSGRSELSPTDADRLTGEIGLDSLDLAVLVVSLEQALGTDPFRDGNARAQTLGELVEVYEQALSS